MPASATTFPLIPRRRLIGLSFGAMQSARRGTGSDVAGSRPYRPGDDVHAIDWAASARLSLARGSDEFVVRERFAEEAPRIVVISDRRPSMSLFPPEQPWLSKPLAAERATTLISDSGVAARGLIGHFEFVGDEASWQPPRSQRPLSAGTEAPFRSPPDGLTRALRHLGLHPRDVPPGTFVFVLSDFLEPPDRRAWLVALSHRWDVVPVVLQDPVWERSFPDISGVVVPLFDPTTGKGTEVRLGRSEVRARREANEERWRTLVATFRALDLEPVVIGSHDRAHLVMAFLAWADRRRLTRGRKW